MMPVAGGGMYALSGRPLAPKTRSPVRPIRTRTTAVRGFASKLFRTPASLNPVLSASVRITSTRFLADGAK